MQTSNLFHKKDFTKVLIVEDEIVLAMAIELSLQKMGFYVSGIEDSPSRAIMHVENNFPDIVLMDINLNCTNTGIDAAIKIWKNYKIPIIFLTSYANDTTINAAMESEPYAYLIKPCKDEELKASINMTLHKHNFFFSNKINLGKSNKDSLLIEGDLEFDRFNSILYKGKKEITLTKNEKKLFEILTQIPDEIVSFETIYSYIWREDLYDMGKLRTLLYRLRIKIESDPFENLYEHGYKVKVIKNFA